MWKYYIYKKTGYKTGKIDIRIGTLKCVWIDY
jgi:hypothetical protein